MKHFRVMKGLVSVIMPVYNAGFFLEEAIRSVMAQSYTEWELLVIDDCSTDDSSILIHSLMEQELRIRYYKTDNPSGSPILPRNIGIRHARGKYIAFLDSDDVWLPDKLEKQLDLFGKYEDMAIGFSDYEKMTEEGERNGRIVRAPAVTTYKELLKGNVIGCLTAVYDTAKVGKLFFRKHSHEDYILWLDILKRGYVARNTQTLEALYRVRGNSVSSNKWKAMRWQWSIYRNIERIGFLGSVYYFLHYAYKAYRKSRI